jgi:3,4-dihydroxy 2-butanone 4-phosphate synthase/GTP cyclohydrolase II
MQTPDAPFSTIEQAIEDFRGGRLVIVVDDPDRENEGDLCMAAAAVTPEAVNFMASSGRGLVCITLPADRCDELDLPPMVIDDGSVEYTAFTITIDARTGIASGISAHDRARTIQLAADGATASGDFVRPGHIFPLRARPAGVLERTGHTEASVDLARLAGFDPPVGVLCEILNEDGTMARLADLTAFGRTHDLRIVTIADLVEYRRSLNGTGVDYPTSATDEALV